MPEMISIAQEELEHLRDRVQKLARDKSHLQLVNNLMNKVSSAQGLENMIEALLRNMLDVIGGTNIILYYLVDDVLYCTDVYGRQSRVERIDDELVKKAFEFRVPIEDEQGFSDTQMLTAEFSKAYTWVFPLFAGRELIGVIKLESLHISMHELFSRQPLIFTYVASVLKNELHSQTRLQQANDQLNRLNDELQQEVMEREQTEEALRNARDELEERVQQRTVELRATNERLQRELLERERAQQAMRSYAEEVEDLYNHAPCGYHSLDRDGVILRMNDTELQWLGYRRDELVGQMRITDILAEQSARSFEELFPQFRKQGWAKDLEFELRRKDGSVFPVLVSATAIYNDDGSFLMSRSTVYDITERKMVERQEHLLSTIVQSSDDAIVAKDLEGTILSWNRGAERIYGYSAGEIVGRPVGLLMAPDQQNEFAGIMESLRRGERIEHHVTQRRRKDGQCITISLTVSPIRDAAGNLLGASSIARDITGQMSAGEEISRLNQELEQRVVSRTNDLESKRIELEESQRALMNLVEDMNLKTEELERANAKLQELDRLKSMFIASMSHELRTPLNSIIGFSSILLDEWIGPVNQEQKENLDTIKRSGRHLLSLINDVIDVSKIEAGRIETRSEEFDLYELMTEAVQYVEKDLHEKGLELHLDIHHHLLCTDRRRLLQCVINLLSNAVKFTERGRIVVAASGAAAGPGGGSEQAAGPASPLIEISVGDTGIGIAGKDMNKLFEPFVRLESPMKITVPGTGLGLYLTRKLVVDVLHGDIVCSSEQGAGSTFTLRIPERIDEKGTGGRG